MADAELMQEIGAAAGGALLGMGLVVGIAKIFFKGPAGKSGKGKGGKTEKAEEKKEEKTEEKPEEK
eukprot:CAMPEP_0183788904 /NCGR_PEP_ID=MMETSP0803_2-20130417/51_1 /TAXON_ID=195967 /ORGANISM="Crustomastix stigmata, Strain CCMP3273" /LENGTH=65 /DNA_ID=CAMNT_0026033053 /DNA_START=65 /DNA_END=259 /DNA_ORIENTATION=-